jgi:murein DD-endopeptidase MepM/ murein hydrolase activator NlpD
LAASTAACSSDINRFSDNTYSNPARPSAAPAYAQGPSSRVESQPLPPQGGYQQGGYQQGGYQQGGYQQPAYQQPPAYQPPPYQQQSYRAPQTQPAMANPRMAAATPNASYSGATGSVRPSSNWSWEGGTAITVAQGDTVESLSLRHHVPVTEIAQANGLAPGARIRPGQRLVIPKYIGRPQTAAAKPAPQMAAAPPRPAAQSRGQYVHVINPGETLMALSRKYNKPLGEIARANKLPINHRARIGERIVIPGVKATAAQQTAAAAPRPAATAPATTQPAAAQPQRVATAEPAAQNAARVMTPAASNEPAAQAEVDTPTGSTGFRWPVRGRVIAGFGPKPTGQQNDGINLSVPEGTPVKAADDGTVAYAGNELKGYGNLVLIRHSNGYVTAYAHASELMVKRGDTVKRGQTIAKSGQTGNVSSPQLHFEVRKGATPIDPMPHLAGAS